MKKLFCAILVSVLSSTNLLPAQDDGMLGPVGSIGGAIGLSGALILGPHWMFGGDLRYFRSVEETTYVIPSNGQGTISSIERSTTEEWSIAPLARYVVPFCDRWQAFAQLRTPLTRGYRTYFRSISDGTGSSDARTLGVGAFVGPGVQFNFSKRWALAADLTLFSSTYEHIEKGPSRNEVGFDAGLEGLTAAVYRLF